jgi:hypothetical protein
MAEYMCGIHYTIMNLFLCNFELTPTWECVLKVDPQIVTRQSVLLSSIHSETTFSNTSNTSNYSKYSSLIYRDTA